jgi:molybdopterin/thiamine biosynthesis adenylyltransferase
MLEHARAQRYRRHDLIDWFSQDQVSAARIAVIGAGAAGNEIVKSLALLGAGTIHVFDFDSVELHNLTRSVLLRETDAGRNKAEAVAERASDIDPNVEVRAFAGDFWDTLSLSDLRDYDCAVAAVDNFEARLKLNQLCQIARVDLVNAALDSRWVAVESFPFGSTDGAACYECTLPDTTYARIAERYSCGGLRRRALIERRVPTTAVTASVAGGLAASAALRFGGDAPTGSRRLLFDTIGGASSVATIERRDGCPGCAAFSRPPDLVRPRNRWNVHAPVAAVATALTATDGAAAGHAATCQDRDLAPDAAVDCGANLADQPIRLSNALITSYACASCGPLAEAARYVNQRASSFDDAIADCPQCGAPSVRVEIRDTFRLGELVERFGAGRVPAKFALAEFGDRVVCFDLEEKRTS